MYALSLATASFACLVLVRVQAYQWPSPLYDALETLLFQGQRTDGSNMASIQHPCKNRGSTNASIGGEWLRLAYHDAATHDSSTGQGGLDASIAFELDRPGNVGSGMVLSLEDLYAYSSKYISRADVIAVGATFAVASCGGPILRFRGGRVDALVADTSDVPLPEQDLATHTQIFERQGFTPQEMISLVACGHTLGGVTSTDRPDIVPPGPDPTVAYIALFDSTPQFDNSVVTQYLAGHSVDPLVTASNATLVSDWRIFSSDNNATMQKLADSETYMATCGSLLERMLETVPSNVVLTDEITLLPAKVETAQLTIERGELVFKTMLRLTQAINTTVNSKRIVTLVWCDRYGTSGGCDTGQAKSTLAASTLIDDPYISPITMRMGYFFVHYSFVVPIAQEESISTFWFTVDEADGSKPTTYNNNGTKYPVQQDTILFVPSMGSLNMYGSTPSSRSFSLVSAVKSALSPSRVYMSAYDNAMPGYAPPLSQDIDMVLNVSMPSVSGYVFYTAGVQDIGAQLTVDLHLVLDNTTYTEDYLSTYFLNTNLPYTPPTAVTTVNILPLATTGRSGSSKIPRFALTDIGLGLVLGLYFI